MPPLTEQQAKEIKLPLNPFRRQAELGRQIGEFGLRVIGFGGVIPIHTRRELVGLARARGRAEEAVATLRIIEEREGDI